MTHGRSERKALALALPPPSASSTTTSSTAICVNFFAEAIAPTAVPWPHLKRAAPLLLPAVASSVVLHQTVERPHPRPLPPDSLVRGDGRPRGFVREVDDLNGRPVASSAPAGCALPPCSLVCGDIPQGRPHGLACGGNNPCSHLMAASASRGAVYTEATSPSAVP